MGMTNKHQEEFQKLMHDAVADNAGLDRAGMRNKTNRAEYPSLFSIDLKGKLGEAQMGQAKRLVVNLRVDEAAWNTMEGSAWDAGVRVGQIVMGQTRSRARLRKSGRSSLLSLRYAEWRDLNRPEIRQLLEKAIESNDFGFFVRLGKVLETKKELSVLEKFKGGMNPLQQFLLVYWTRKDGLPLCLLSRHGLTTVCRVALDKDEKSLTTATIEKTLIRLGLKRFQGRKLTADLDPTTKKVVFMLESAGLKSAPQ